MEGPKQEWSIIKSESLIDNKWLKIRKDSVLLPTGVMIEDYYVLDYPDWVNVIAITEDGQFVMERQYRHGTKSVDFELCAGTVEKGEQPVEAAKRELLEETGYAGGDWKLFCISAPNPAAMTNRNYTFLAQGVKYTGARHLEKTEDIDIFLMNYVELKETVVNGGFLQGQMLAPLWKYIAEHK